MIPAQPENIELDAPKRCAHRIAVVKTEGQIGVGFGVGRFGRLGPEAALPRCCIIMACSLPWSLCLGISGTN